ncbi:hypothetical protein IJ579_06460 [bacterium]|nr:hypothetical protein [bacterium]
MSANKEIKTIMLQEGLTIAKLVRLIAARQEKKYTADGLAKKLRNNTLKFNEAEMIADTLDYDIIFRKRRHEM